LGRQEHSILLAALLRKHAAPPAVLLPVVGTKPLLTHRSPGPPSIYCQCDEHDTIFRFVLSYFWQCGCLIRLLATASGTAQQQSSSS
jgi:hypothetical protein